MEEMPAEEGYPVYLAARLAEFYERAGYVETFNDQFGSVSIIGAVSPGGDFSEPVVQHTKRFIRCFWALDKSSPPRGTSLDQLAGFLQRVHSGCGEMVAAETETDWYKLRNEAVTLSRGESFEQIVKLVGPDALPDEQRLVLETSRIIREGFLQQNAMDDIDSYSTVQNRLA